MAKDVGKVLTGTLITIIVVVIIMSSGSSLFTPLSQAGLNETQLCSSGCFYNGSRAAAAHCTAFNTSGGDLGDTEPCQTAGAIMPLSSLWNTGGVVALVFGAAVIILAILALFGLVKKKGLAR